MKICTNKKNAFTLAEVLITLGIVGVVAAMTIPALIANYQKNVWEAKIKKVYSIATNACERMLTTEEVSAVDETDLYSSITTANVKKYFKIMQDVSNGKVYLPDGAVMTITKDTTNKALKFVVDVNDTTKPNVAGRDQFEFSLGSDCTYDYSKVTGSSSQAAQKFKTLIGSDWKISD